MRFDRGNFKNRVNANSYISFKKALDEKPVVWALAMRQRVKWRAFPRNVKDFYHLYFKNNERVRVFKRIPAVVDLVDNYILHSVYSFGVVVKLLLNFIILSLN